MATIVFILYPEAGHLFPTFKLARSLKRRGHRIHYFGPVDFEADIRAQGFDFIPILEQLWPRLLNASRETRPSGHGSK